MNKSKRILLLIILMCISLIACTESAKESNPTATPTDAEEADRNGHVQFIDENPDLDDVTTEVDITRSIGSQNVEGLE